jgi:hypothetical protein
MSKRRRFNQDVPSGDGMDAWAKEVREQAGKLPPGPEREALLKKLRQANTAAHIEEWANSPGLKPPT